MPGNNEISFLVSFSWNLRPRRGVQTKQKNEKNEKNEENEKNEKNEKNAYFRGP